jgi:nucleoside 2-deoxyribosyltransferase
MTTEKEDSHPAHLIYLAAPLFTPLERERNLVLATELRKAGHEVFLPQEINAAKGSGGLDLRKIYTECSDSIHHAALLVAIVDGPDVDSGVAWELGYATAKGVRTICIRTDRRKAEGNGVNIMIEFCATKMIYETGFKTPSSTVMAVLLAAIQNQLGV